MGRGRKSQVNCSPKVLELEGEEGPLGSSGQEVDCPMSNIDKLEAHLDSQSQQPFYPPETEWAENEKDPDPDNGSIASTGLDSSSSGVKPRRSTRLQLKEQQNVSPLKESPQPSVKAIQGKRKRQSRKQKLEVDSEQAGPGGSMGVDLSLVKQERDQDDWDFDESTKESTVVMSANGPQNSHQLNGMKKTRAVRIKDEPVSPPPEPADLDLLDNEPSDQLFDNYAALLAFHARSQNGGSFVGRGDPEANDLQNEGELPGTGMAMVPYVFPSPPMNHVERYAPLTPFQQIACLTQDLENCQVMYRQAMETVQSGRALNDTLLKENADLREASTRERDIAKNEKTRAEEAWKKMETMQLYNSVGVNGTEQRYFLSQKYSDAVDSVKEDYEGRLKEMEEDRNKHSSQNEILNRKITKVVKRYQSFKRRVVKPQKALVAALSRVVGKILVVNGMELSSVKGIVGEAVAQFSAEMGGEPANVFEGCFDAWEGEEKLAAAICDGLLKGLGKQEESPKGVVEEDDEDADDEFEDVPEPPAKMAKIDEDQEEEMKETIKTEEEPPQENGCVQVNPQVEEAGAMDEGEVDDFVVGSLVF